MLSCLRDIDPIKFQVLFNKLLEEFRNIVATKNCTSRHLVRIYLSYMTIYSRSAINEDDAKMLNQFTNEVVEYWVSRGFDSDELIALGSRKSIEFLIQVAQKCPKLENTLFSFHIRAFVANLTKAALLRPKPDKTSPLHRVSKVSLK